MLSIAMDSAFFAACESPAPATEKKSAPFKSKRDEWSQSGVFLLLDVYESKWLLRNRTKLKRSDWEDIAHKVSILCSGKKILKTPSQCKNKIESMKKRYRAEAAAAAEQASSCSSWQFFERMYGLLKGAPNFSAMPKSYNNHYSTSNGITLQIPVKEDELDVEGGGNLHESNNHDGGPKNSPEDVDGGKNNDGRTESRGVDSYFSTSRCKEVMQDNVSKRRKGLNDVAESMQLLAHSILKIEHGRMEMFKESERIRAEVEIKKGEMELKRAEIIAKTQLQIANLLVKRLYGRSSVQGGSHLKTELDMLSRREVMEAVEGRPLSQIEVFKRTHMRKTSTYFIDGRSTKFMGD